MSKELDPSVKSFRTNLINLAKDNNLNLTNEIITEINGIVNGLDSLKLDNMFLTDSKDWSSKFNQANLAHDQYSNSKNNFFIF